MIQPCCLCACIVLLTTVTFLNRPTLPGQGVHARPRLYKIVLPTPWEALAAQESSTPTPPEIHAAEHGKGLQRARGETGTRGRKSPGKPSGCEQPMRTLRERRSSPSRRKGEHTLGGARKYHATPRRKALEEGRELAHRGMRRRSVGRLTSRANQRPGWGRSKKERKERGRISNSVPYKFDERGSRVSKHLRV